MEEQFEYKVQPIEDTEQLFEDTKQGIIEIMQEDTKAKVATYEFAGHEFAYHADEVMEMLNNTQKINLGFIEEVKVKDIHGEEIVMHKTEYVQRNMFAFANNTACDMQLDKIKEKVNAMESFLDFVDLNNLENALTALEIAELENKYAYVPEVVVDDDALIENEEIEEPIVDEPS